MRELFHNVTSSIPEKIWFNIDDYITQDRLITFVGSSAYYMLDHKITKQIWKLLPQSLIEAERTYSNNYIAPVLIQVVEGATSLNPHVDSGRRSVLNWYIETGNGRTISFDSDDIAYDTELKDHAKIIFNATGHWIPTGVVNHIEAAPRDFFLAKPNEKWLLDVSKPHMVHKIESKRISLSCSFCLPYNEVVKYFV